MRKYKVKRIIHTFLPMHTKQLFEVTVTASELNLKRVWKLSRKYHHKKIETILHGRPIF